MPPPRLFFTHVMKTAGSSIVFQMVRVYPDEIRYPGPSLGGSTLDAKATMAHLQRCDPEVVDTIQFFAPHLPYCATEAIGFEGTTMTLVRHPVHRAVSHLLHLVWFLESRLETEVDPRRVYEIRPIRDWLLSNHQVRVFSLGQHEAADWDAAMDCQHTIDAWFDNEGRSSVEDLQPIPMDEHRLEAAEHALDSVDLVGVTRDIEGFLTLLRDRTGISLDPGLRVNVREPVELDPALVEQIEAENSLEMALYEHACRLADAKPELP